MWLPILPVGSPPVTNQVPLQDRLFLIRFQHQRHWPLSSKQLQIKPNYIKDEIHILELLQYLHSLGNDAEQSAHHELYKCQ